MRLLKDNYIYILINLFIAFSYVSVLRFVSVHGNDDFHACTYYFFPDTTFSEKISQIVERITTWNMRIGEILYFIIGGTNQYVHFIFATGLMIFLVNLLAYYSLGYEKFKSKNKAGICCLVAYLICILLWPTISEVFFWMGGIYNHIFSLVVILLVGIPYRNLIDGIDGLKKIDIKYILYLIFCIIAGFGSEATVGTMILALTICNIYLAIKNKKIDIKKVLPLIFLAVSYIIFLILSKTRITVQGSHEFSLYTKQNMKSMFFENRLLEIIIVSSITIIYFIIYKLKNISEDIKIIALVGISALSLFVIQFATYYLNRAIIIFDTGITIWCIYCIYNIILTRKIELIKAFFSIFIIIYTCYITHAYKNLYIDYNKFCALRSEYIFDEIAQKRYVHFL